MIRDTTPAESVEQYVDGVLSGDVVACKFVQKVVARYVDERSKTQTVDFPYTFDEETANRVCQFFPLLLRHSIGEWAGQSFELAPWQQFCLFNIFGWKKPDGTRKIRKAFVSLARKQGKSTWAAGLAILLALADGEQGAQVYVAASKVEQAKIIFTESMRMVQQSTAIKKHAEIFKLNIAFPTMDSYIRPIGSDRSFDGLSPHCTIFDELHAWNESKREFLNTMTTAGGARRQPLQLVVTTAGSEKSHIYNEQAEYVRGVVDGTIQDPTVWGVIYELDEDDDIFDENVWLKSNPNIGRSCKIEYLREQANRYSQLTNSGPWIRYHANRCVSSVEHIVTAELWDDNAGPLSDWRTADAIGIGVDVGGSFDLASIGLVAKWNVGDDDKPKYRYEARSINFVNSQTKRDCEQEPIRTWISLDLLLRSEYPVSEIQDRVLDEGMTLGAQVIAYDPWNASQLAEHWEQAGMLPVKMPQTTAHFHEVLQEFQLALQERRFSPYDKDPILRWCALNLAMKTDHNERTMPDRKNSKEKIDSIVSVLMALRAVQAAPKRAKGKLVL